MPEVTCKVSSADISMLSSPLLTFTSSRPMPTTSLFSTELRGRYGFDPFYHNNAAMRLAFLQFIHGGKKIMKDVACNVSTVASLSEPEIC